MPEETPVQTPAETPPSPGQATETPESQPEKTREVRLGDQVYNLTQAQEQAALEHGLFYDQRSKSLREELSQKESDLTRREQALAAREATSPPRQPAPDAPTPQADELDAVIAQMKQDPMASQAMIQGYEMLAKRTRAAEQRSAALESRYDTDSEAAYESQLAAFRSGELAKQFPEVMDDRLWSAIKNDITDRVQSELRAGRDGSAVNGFKVAQEWVDWKRAGNMSFLRDKAKQTTATPSNSALPPGGPSVPTAPGHDPNFWRNMKDRARALDAGGVTK